MEDEAHQHGPWLGLPRVAVVAHDARKDTEVRERVVGRDTEPRPIPYSGQ